MFAAMQVRMMQDSMLSALSLYLYSLQGAWGIEGKIGFVSLGLQRAGMHYSNWANQLSIKAKTTITRIPITTALLTSKNLERQEDDSK